MSSETVPPLYAPIFSRFRVGRRRATRAPKAICARALCPEKDVYVKNININRSRDRSERPFKNVKSEKVETRDLRKRMFSVAAHGS